MSAVEQKSIQEIAQYLYRSMPGALRVPCNEYTDYREGWGEVEDTEHYQFCEAIAQLLVLQRSSEQTQVTPHDNGRR